MGNLPINWLAWFLKHQQYHIRHLPAMYLPRLFKEIGNKAAANSLLTFQLSHFCQLFALEILQNTNGTQKLARFSCALAPNIAQIHPVLSWLFWIFETSNETCQIQTFRWNWAAAPPTSKCFSSMTRSQDRLEELPMSEDVGRDCVGCLSIANYIHEHVWWLVGLV